MSVSRRALIVIDVQNEYVSGDLPIEYPDVRHSLQNIGRSIDAARAAGVCVIVVQQSAPAGSPIFARGSSGWNLHEVVQSRAHDHYVEKNLPSAFVGTDLADWLRKRAIGTLAVAGYMTHNCIDSTVKQALHDGFQVEFLSDASGSVSYSNAAGTASAEEIHRAFCVVLQSRFAAVVSTDQWIAALQSGLPLRRDSIHSSNQAARAQAKQVTRDDAARPPFTLRPLADQDAARIARWPAYPAEFADLDYALRDRGWLSDYRHRPAARCFVAEAAGDLLGFTILAKTGATEAEFRIALRPDLIGAGLGQHLARRTLALAFDEPGLMRVHLLVRLNNPRAIRLYQRLGFVPRETRRETFNGKEAEFLVMDKLRNRESDAATAPSRDDRPAGSLLSQPSGGRSDNV